jgi:hypothetical protein
MKLEDLHSKDTPLTNEAMFPVYFPDFTTYAVDPEFSKALERKIAELTKQLNETRTNWTLGR